jgi:hypothetical protein
VNVLSLNCMRIFSPGSAVPQMGTGMPLCRIMLSLMMAGSFTWADAAMLNNNHSQTQSPLPHTRPRTKRLCGEELPDPLYPQRPLPDTRLRTERLCGEDDWLRVTAYLNFIWVICGNCFMVFVRLIPGRPGNQAGYRLSGR